ncbi:MAG TPA: hypothetical protein VJ761_10105, partial [Ktedonobacteraceae bacterium]|nr:hypothetical protein [Ktedonobacteraceae bacterium]
GALVAARGGGPPTVANMPAVGACMLAIEIEPIMDVYTRHYGWTPHAGGHKDPIPAGIRLSKELPIALSLCNSRRDFYVN